MYLIILPLAHCAPAFPSNFCSTKDFARTAQRKNDVLQHVFCFKPAAANLKMTEASSRRLSNPPQFPSISGRAAPLCSLFARRAVGCVSQQRSAENHRALQGFLALRDRCVRPTLAPLTCIFFIHRATCGNFGGARRFRAATFSLARSILGPGC